MKLVCYLKSALEPSLQFRGTRTSLHRLGQRMCFNGPDRRAHTGTDYLA